MIRFLYLGNYDDEEIEPQPTISMRAAEIEISAASIVQQQLLVINADVYALAEKYGIPGLKVCARQKFRAALPAGSYRM